MPTNDLLITKGLSETLAPAAPKSKGAKDWLEAAQPLPALQRVDGALVEPGAGEALIAALQKKKHPAPALLEPYTEATREQLGWALLHAWIRGRGPAQGSWTPFAVATLGPAHSTPRKLAQLVRQLARDKCSAAAIHVIDAIATIEGDPTLIALTRLDGIMPKEVGAAAGAHAKKIAKRRDLGSEDIEDLLVPDCSLGSDLVLDFGPRKFHVVFDEKLAASLRDQAGKAVASLPRVSKTDDPKKAEAAREAWTEAKAVLKDTLRGQSHRFEWAMCAERRWTVERFTAAIVGHPILCAIAQRLVFGMYASDETPNHHKTFRIAEDKTFADANDEPIELEGWIGIPHVLHIGPAELAAWGTVLADYAIIQPFPQLGRDTYTPTHGEAASREVERHRGRLLDPKSRFVLESLGWSEAENWEDLDFTCTLVDGETEAYVRLGSKFDSSNTTLHCWLKGSKKLGDLDPIAFSELLRDLQRLPSRRTG